AVASVDRQPGDRRPSGRCATAKHDPASIFRARACASRRDNRCDARQSARVVCSDAASTEHDHPHSISKENPMQGTTRRTWMIAAALTALGGCAGMQSSQPGPANMSFFVTSVGVGNGADLGGLEGADRHCQALAKAAGAGDRTWRAYLSTQASGLTDPKFVNARDRIGTGPWQNAKGVVIARSVD